MYMVRTAVNEKHKFTFKKNYNIPSFLTMHFYSF